ncbi:helix-turn-helix domain-containing protein [Flavobacterium sp. xlx-214]|uniref:helix-turn-helix domain-containing protein n=1 Tax=unclassified Flavobacterium TaxID=196869 RepID=UPI0013CFA278|nr:MULTISPECIES: helix-turn-helix domain-containing protein [unclassified Flavobacterium]MBA5791570.1 helix-turn-helix domain-containing protein [Flavobacterium sp. xlx-221]QMI82819.1 helix-turn-helix domain-containing protein [Flavobacterium sp. xlx-214]
MNIDRTEFIAWMKRIMQRFDILDEVCKTKNNRLEVVDGEELLDNQDLLLLLKISNRSLQRYRSNGKLPYYSISGKIYYKRSDVEQVIRESYSRSVGDRKKNKEG